MAAPARQRKYPKGRRTAAPNGMHADGQGFDITCTVGQVRFSDNGPQVSPYAAAFAVIGEHNAEGTFRFPAVDGGTVEVEVVYRDAE